MKSGCWTNFTCVCLYKEKYSLSIPQDKSIHSIAQKGEILFPGHAPEIEVQNHLLYFFFVI